MHHESQPQTGIRALGISLLVLAGASACSGSTTLSTASPSGSADLLVSSSGSSESFSLHGQLQEVRLVTASGQRSANLLSESSEVEFVGQESSSEWLGRADVTVGEYESLEVRFDPTSVVRMDAGGAREPLPMEAASGGRVLVPLDRRLEVLQGSSQRLLLHIDLDGSVSVGGLGGPTFEPDFDVLADMPTSLETVVARVLTASQSARTLLLEQRFEGLERPAAFDLQLSNRTMLFDVNGQPFPSEGSFFASLLLRSTWLEVRGVLGSDGVLDATDVRIREYSGNAADRVRIEGMVLDVDSLGNRFTMLMRDVKEGGEVVARALEPLGNPSSIDVHYDPGTIFTLASGAPVSAQDLRPGQWVDVTFVQFQAPPFLADRVSLDTREVCFGARVTDVSQLPDRITVRTDALCPLVRSGDIRSEDTDIVVELAGADLRLKLQTRPALAAASLYVGAKVNLCGDLRGTPDDPILDASSVGVHPGHLIKGDAVQARRGLSSFVVASGKIVQPFGAEVALLPADVRIDPNACFLQAAHSEAEFFDALESLGNRTADVKIKGIQSGAPGEILAFEIKLKIR